MKRMSFSVIHASRGAQPKSWESQWLKFVPRWMTKPEGLAGVSAEAIRGRRQNGTKRRQRIRVMVYLGHERWKPSPPHLREESAVDPGPAPVAESNDRLRRSSDSRWS